MKAFFSTHRLDVAALVLIGLLMLAIGLTLIGGDRAGVAVTATFPLNQAHARTPIRVTFGEPMNAEDVQSRFNIDPPVKGTFSWTGTQLTFTPGHAWTSGQQYTVTIRAGATSVQQRRLNEDVSWSFTVVAPRVVYLSPAVKAPGSDSPNLWLIDPAVPFVPKQLTHSRSGLLADFAVSPGGTQIAFAEVGDRGTADLYILTVETGEIQQITRCIDARCQAPDWSPDGTRLVYERIELNSSLPDIDRGVPRAWIVNLADLTTAPLLASSQLLGKAPHWSPTGTQIALVDQNAQGIVLYNIQTADRQIIPSLVGENGVFDPTGARLIYPELQQTPQGFFTVFSVADLTNQSLRPLTERNRLFEDGQASWRPDGKQVAITRKYMDEDITPGRQLFLVDPDSGVGTPLISDPNYNQGAISWDPAGEQLVIQRFPYGDAEAQPGIWVYNLREKAITHIARNGFLPQWLP